MNKRRDSSDKRKSFSVKMKTNNEPINKKKLSGAEGKKLREEKLQAALKNSQNISVFFGKGLCNCIIH